MLKDDSLHGRAVLSGDGVRIGEVTHLLVDTQSLRIAALEVRLHKEVADRVGLPHGILRGPMIHIPSDQVQSIGDAVILTVPVNGLRDVEPAADPIERPGAHPQPR